jgi:radical SAM protein with 4Fe4S-binding SPASM domain
LVEAGESSLDELSLEEIRNVIDQLAKMKVFNITFSGGEPLMRRDFFEILRYASRSNIGIKFSTNGFLINKQIMKKLDSINVFAVQISIDGIEKTHDDFRGRRGSFTKAVEALRRFSSEGYWTIVSVMMTKYNVNELQSILELAISLGATTFKLSSFIPIGRGKKNIDELLLSPLETKVIAKEMTELKKKFENKIQFEIDGTFPWLLENFPTSSGIINGSNLRVGCSAGRSQIVISPDGKVYPCPFLRDFVAGDLRRKRLEEIWRDSKIFNIFRNITKEKLGGKCGSCAYVPAYCQGGCRAAAYAHSKDIYGEDPLCWYKIVEKTSRK